MLDSPLVVNAYSKLGDRIQNLNVASLNKWLTGAKLDNPWFSENNVKFSLDQWANLLCEQNITDWLSIYESQTGIEKTIGVVAAGNIPLVGLHDALCVLATGNILKIKPSSDDNFLIKSVLQLLQEIEPQFKNKIQFVDRMNEVDAIIATGSTNTSRYFEYYFSKIPHIIRKNRTSVAILAGDEIKEDFIKLGKDVFTYFGLGCRNVTKLFLPKNFNFIPLLDQWTELTSLIQHHKYANNYEYHRGIFLMNQIPIYDNGIVILKEDESLYSAVSVLNYVFYENENSLNEILKRDADHIQCIVSNNSNINYSIPLGTAQSPSLNTYADNIDVINFLLNIH